MRLFKMPTEEKEDDKKEWKNSKGKELLLKGLRDGSIPLDGKDMPPKEVYTLRPEFADYGGYKNFPSRLRSARKTIIEKNDRASSDLAAFTHDRLLYPEAPHNYRGEPRWDGSDAERLLKQDIDDGKHEQSGSEIISSNPKLTLNSYYSKDSKHLYIAKEMDENNAQLLRVGFGMKKQSGSEYLKNAENAFSAYGPVKFIRMFEHGDKIFIFFRETLEGGREVSRVATICSNDNGGSQNILTNKFTTFVKTTIECEVSKQFSFR